MHDPEAQHYALCLESTFVSEENEARCFFYKILVMNLFVFQAYDLVETVSRVTFDERLNR